ncbi:Arylsulfatase [Maioricimonas rarisocia]|uniref:Arylsulfatase n=1 Tax=Maioricimonas rarisocia TaxID=2528026 RepID=A0A517Z8C8_9PLAN|nr:sulfatase-like hydrolase/transferase [Maioricimonas rarisocia]QDU38691.1 Arylsulfatase [Maioricimonas rarisocia]
MPRHPNVLLITTDHWPAALLGCAGHPAIQTPTLDELARCGTRFTNAYSECPVCIPARRSLMTGLNPRSHGDRTFQTTLPMPDAPTLAGCFREAGYQAYAVGKVHVYPQRARIGFDDILLAEEGRPHWGVWDDYDVYLGEQGFAGRQFDHAMSNNQYSARPWHLPEETHVTNWTAREASKMIRRRDPTRPGFWCVSFTHPHPPLVPPAVYWDMYADIEPEWPRYGDWVPQGWRVHPDGAAHFAADDHSPPYRVQQQHEGWHVRTPAAIRTALRGFYALCTQIDHQLRLVLGTLREEGLLDETIILFTADHGDMLGHHGLWAKRLYYEYSANVPMLLLGTQGDDRVAVNTVDDRLVGLQDVMPTLLDLAGLPVPEGCDGRSMATGSRREFLYGECNEGELAARMMHDGRHKLLYYPAGNRFQLFDLHRDPYECHNVVNDSHYTEVRRQLTERLIAELYGSDRDWLDGDGQLVGLPDAVAEESGNRGLALQRGVHWPPAPVRPPQPGETNPGTN